MNEHLIKKDNSNIHKTIFLKDNTILKRRVERFMVLLERDMKLNEQYKHIEGNSYILLAVFSHNSLLPTDDISYFDLIEIFGDKRRYKFEIEYHDYLSHFELRRDVSILLFGIKKPEIKKNKICCC
jgi:hypothetical protein